MKANDQIPESAEELLHRMEFDRKRAAFFEERSDALTFTYYLGSKEVILSERGAAELGLESRLAIPGSAKTLLEMVGIEQMKKITQLCRSVTPEHPNVTAQVQLTKEGKSQDFMLNICYFWADEDRTLLLGGVGTLEEVLSEEERRKATPAAPSLRLMNLLQGSLSVRQVVAAMQTAALTYDTVRLVNPQTFDQFTVGENGQLVPGKCCYEMLGCTEACANCIARQVVSRQARQAEFKFSPNETFYVQALYVDVEKKPLVMELISRIADDTFMDASGQEKLVEAISAHNRRMYTDSLTGVYNRRYYDEILSQTEGEDLAVVMVDADHFKTVNDTYGHLIGDEALKTIAASISSCIRSKDALVRYGGDEFLVVFRNMPESVLAPKLEMIRQRVSEARLETQADLQLTISIGGIHGNGKVSDMLGQADAMMYQAKVKRNSVVTGKME